MLQDILHSIITGAAPPIQTLSGGLMLQYRHGGSDGPHKLLVYRRGSVPPSTLEYATVRRELERVVAIEVALSDDEINYTASDGLSRRGRVFSWRPAATQPALL